MIIGGSPRKDGNSELLCKEFARGAETAGNHVEYISLSVVTEDCFSTCVKEDGTLELMLIRTPYFAHHEPYIPPENHF